MVDLHNHILPGIDDGAQDLADALAMARQAVEDGTTVMAATPHRFSHGNEITGKLVDENVKRLQRSLDRHQIPLRIVPGIEIPMKPDTHKALRDGTLIPLGGAKGKYVLIEPPFDRIPAHALPLLEQIIELRLTPIIAHPERNSEVQKHLAFLETCSSRGMIIQLTAGSIIGKFGPQSQKCAREIVKHRDWKIIIASDAHDQIDRTPNDMTHAMECVAEWLGDEAAAKRMVNELPRSLIA